MKTAPIESLTCAVFAGLIRTPFQVRSGEKTVELILDEAIPSDDVLASENEERYRLIFHGPVSTLLPQQVHALEHAQLGRFDLFLAAINRTPTSFEYQALFNRGHYASK